MVFTKEDVISQLKEIGFTDELIYERAVGNLSGGWRMKLALSRAILQKADILLLDEPTNHLDVMNVQWLMVRFCPPLLPSLFVDHGRHVTEPSRLKD